MLKRTGAEANWASEKMELLVEIYACIVLHGSGAFMLDRGSGLGNLDLQAVDA